ncbi:MAG: phosphate ABC transporter substrate-binding protein, PhoT family [Bacteroidetes bacterium]|nr:MAG: phosphate ABC transporter substrate-binding protein, PhoT family [Bacteroidota bacterium]
MRVINNVIFLLISTLFLWCSKKETQTDTATYGKISIACDESFKPIIEAELDVFRAEYTNAEITPKYLSEGESYKQFLQDSVRLIVTSRLLNTQEENYFKQKQIIPKINKIASDGIALLISQKNKDTLLTLKMVEKICKGEITTWNQINTKRKKEPISVVFDNNNSGSLRFLREKFDIPTIPPHLSAAGSSEKVLAYIAQNPNAIGIVGVNWLSDTDDPIVRKYLKDIHFIAISPSENPKTEADYLLPFQNDVFLDTYPLSRNIYIISRESRTGLGTGFNAFVMGERGQRIILKAGIVPSTLPMRIIQIKKGMP